MKNGLLTVLVVGFLIIGLIGNVNASTVFTDDFEDGNLNGWLASTTGGSGGSGVADHNNSKMGYVSHTGSSSHSLSYDFSYMADNILSFDIQAIAVKSGGGNNVTLHSGSGVSVTFLNMWNQNLGIVRFTNVTSSSLLGANDFYIDNNQHEYSAKLFDYAVKAGVSDFTEVAKVNLSFWAWGSQHHYTASGYTDRSSAKVYFDNVNISSVPLPAALCLFGSGIAGLATFRKRSKS